MVYKELEITRIQEIRTDFNKKRPPMIVNVETSDGPYRLKFPRKSLNSLKNYIAFHLGGIKKIKKGK